MKATLIGRPKRIVEETNDSLKAIFEHVYVKSPPLPKGVPALPSTPTPYVVFIGGKQWRKVKEALNDPEDNLILEGYVAYDPAIRSMVLCTQSCISVKQQRASREQQRAVAEGEKPGDAVPAESEPGGNNQAVSATSPEEANGQAGSGGALGAA